MRYKGADSGKLLDSVGEKIDAAGYKVGNIDVTMIAQRPKLRPYIDRMRENIATHLGIDPARVNVKATTEEHLGFTGEGKGAAHRPGAGEREGHHGGKAGLHRHRRRHGLPRGVPAGRKMTKFPSLA